MTDPMKMRASLVLLALAATAARGESAPEPAACSAEALGTARVLPVDAAFPGFASSQALLDRLQRRGIVVFGADLWASDWNAMSPPGELALVLARVEANRGGIVLFHDTRAQTAAMLAAFLRALKSRGYRLVHVVPAAER